MACPRNMCHLLSKRYSTLTSRDKERISLSSVEDRRCDYSLRSNLVVVLFKIEMDMHV